MDGASDARGCVAVLEYVLERLLFRAQTLGAVLLQRVDERILRAEQLVEVAVGAPERLVDGDPFARLRVGVQYLAQERLREIAPIAELVPIAQYIGAIFHTEPFPIGINEPPFQQLPVLAKEDDVADDVLDHRLGVPAGKEFAKDLIADHGDAELLVHAAQFVAFLHQAVAEQIIAQLPAAGAGILEDTLVVDALLGLHGDGMAVDAQFVEHVQRRKAAVQERIARQDRFADVAAPGGHALDEALGAPGAVYDPIEVPRVYLFARAYCPTVLGARVQRTDVVGDAEAENGQYPLPGAEAAFVRFVQKGQIAHRTLEDDAQLLFVQLMGDDAIVRSRLLGQEGARFHFAENAVGFLARGGIHIPAQRIQLVFDIGTEFFIGAAVLGRAMAAVGGVIIQLLLCAPEHFLVCLREGAQKHPQALEIAFVPFVGLYLGLGEESFAVAEFVEHTPIVDAFDVVDQRHGFAQQSGKLRLGVVKTLLKGEFPVLLKLHGAECGGAGLSAREKVDDGGDLPVLGDVARRGDQRRTLAASVQRAVCQRAGKRLSVGEAKARLCSSRR